MRVLVSVASKHGATGEIGEIIGGVLRDAQMDIVSEAPERVRSIDGYDAVILGSAVYAGRWMGSARSFAERHEAALVTRPVWLFSSGPIGDPPMPAGDVDEATEVAERIGRGSTGRSRGGSTGIGSASWNGRSPRSSARRTVTSATSTPSAPGPMKSSRAWRRG